MQEEYRKKNHTLYEGNGSDFIFKDPYSLDLCVIAGAIADVGNRYWLDRVEVALSFVQNLPFQEMGSYQRYAVETLIDGRGDCSDKSILFAGLLDVWDYDWVFLVFDEHLAIGIWRPCGLPGWRYFFMRRCYYYCETSGEGWHVGDCPPEYEDVPCEIENP